jgi:hypothetical protein
MPIAFLDDIRYYTDYTFYQSHFRWNTNRCSSRTTLYHCFWSGRISQYHELCLKSLLLTQAEPLAVWLWLTPETLENRSPALDVIGALPCVTLKEYRPSHEARGTVLEGSPLLTPNRPATASDAFRVLVQLKYGGVYFDMDVLFLDDLRPLLDVEFFWQWSNQPFGTNAISHFRKGSPNIRALARRGLHEGTFFPPRLFDLTGDSSWPARVVALPSFLFSPAWIAHDTGMATNAYCNHIDDFFESTTTVSWADFFPGSYAYHWHNGWNRPIRKSSIVGQLLAEVRRTYDSHVARRGRNVPRVARR